MGLWGYNFNRDSRWQRSRKGFSAFYLSAIFVLPPVIYYLLGNPAVSNFYMKKVMPVEYPPESDPSIISRIYHGEPREGDSTKGKAK